MDSSPFTRAAGGHPFRIVERSDPDWEIAWRELREHLKLLPADHPLVGRTIDDFMLIGASGERCHFKDICTRAYLHVALRS